MAGIREQAGEKSEEAGADAPIHVCNLRHVERFGLLVNSDFARFRRGLFFSCRQMGSFRLPPQGR